jgi:hypothetical protein
VSYFQVSRTHLELHAVDEVAVAGDVRLLEHAEHRDLALAKVAHADAQLVLVSRVKCELSGVSGVVVIGGSDRG